MPILEPAKVQELKDAFLRLLPKLDVDKRAGLSITEVNRGIDSGQIQDPKEVQALATLKRFHSELSDLSPPSGLSGALNLDWGAFGRSRREWRTVTLADMERLAELSAGGSTEARPPALVAAVEKTLLRATEGLRTPLTPEQLAPDHNLRLGYSGDCAFLAALTSIEYHRPELARGMIARQGEGYTVTFPGRAGAVSITSPTDPERALFAHGARAPILEKAFVKQLKETKRSERTADLAASEVSSAGIWLKEGLQIFSATPVRPVSVKALSESALGFQLDQIAEKRLIATAGTPAHLSAADEQLGLTNSHAYAVIGYKDRQVLLLDPIEPAKGRTWKVLAVPVERFHRAFSQLAWME